MEWLLHSSYREVLNMPPVLAYPEAEVLTGQEPPAPQAPPPKREIRGPRGADWLTASLLERSSTKPGRLTLKILFSTTLHIVDTADHSFHVLKSSGQTDAHALRELAQTISIWAKRWI